MLGRVQHALDSASAKLGPRHLQRCLIVEQRMSECLEIADRAYILQTGRVLMQGSAAEISANPDVRKAYLGM